MTTLLINDDILPIGEAKAQLSRILRGLSERGRPVVITQNGRPAGVMLTPAEYDRLTARDRLTAAIEVGMAQADAGLGHSPEEVGSMLDREFGPLESE